MFFKNSVNSDYIERIYIKSQPEENMKRRKSSFKIWTPAEDELIVRLDEENKTRREMKRILNAKHRRGRSVSAVTARIHKLRRIERPNVINGEELLGLYERLEEHERTHMRPQMGGRERIFYNALKVQADELRKYDELSQREAQNSKYQNMPLSQLALLPENERNEIMEILGGENSYQERSSLKNLDLILVPGYGEERNKAFVILPLYHEDMQFPPESVRSTVYDLTITALLCEGKFEADEHEGESARWKELKRYNLAYTSETADLVDVEREINSALQQKFDLEVSMHVENPYFFHGTYKTF